jgi:hypothetical protein
MLKERVKLVLKNGGKHLSEIQKGEIASLVNSSNFEVIILQYRDQGVYSAMNQALEYSKRNGHLDSVEWVWFLNSGDRLETNSHKDLKELQNVPNSSFIVCGDPTRGLKMKFNETVQIDAHKLLDGSIVIGHQVALFRPEVFYKFGLYDEKKKIVSDYILMHKVLSKSSLTKTKFPRIEYEDGGMSRVKLVTQELEKIAYVFQIFKTSYDKRAIKLLSHKTKGLLKHIAKLGIERLRYKILRKNKLGKN